jgi:hypothetical protein
VNPACCTTRCSKQSVCKATVNCKGCPAIKRQKTSHYCQEHLNMAVRGDMECTNCNTRIKVSDWERLPVKAAEPAKPVRVGDATRQTYIERLSEAFAGGFLTREEYDERVDKVPNSKFEIELHDLVSDLPAPAQPAPLQPASPSFRLLSAWQWVGIALMAALIISLACLAFI